MDPDNVDNIVNGILGGQGTNQLPTTSTSDYSSLSPQQQVAADVAAEQGQGQSLMQKIMTGLNKGLGNSSTQGSQYANTVSKLGQPLPPIQSPGGGGIQSAPIHNPQASSQSLLQLLFGQGNNTGGTQ